MKTVVIGFLGSVLDVGKSADRWRAWTNIYGDDPRGNPEYAKYRNEHTGGRLGM